MRLVALLGLAALTTPLAWGACPDYASDPSLLLELESDAGRGALSDEQVACLESNYAAAPTQTTKDKISRVLLVHAYAYDTEWWAELVQRHLDEVDRSDPNIAYLYAFYLYNRDNPDYEAVIQWVDVALDRKQEWSGSLHVHRVTRLLEARTYASYHLWEHAQQQGTADVAELRATTKTYAREWLDFTRSSGQDTATAAEFCVSVASRSACGLADDE